MPDISRRTTALSAALLAALGTAAPAAATTEPAVLHTSAAIPRHHFVDPHGRAIHSTSSNWAGYAATGRTFTSITASWTQPAVSCTGTSYSSYWIGLDGDGSSTVEQTGSEADCSGSTPTYYAWYEMYPAYPVNFANTVRPGDQLTATVAYNGSGSFTLRLSDTTEGWTRTVDKTLRSAKRASAEVIAEAPSSSSGVLPLADFHSVSFGGALVDGSPIGGFNPDRITMATGSTTKATTSALSGGDNFSVTWQHS